MAKQPTTADMNPTAASSEAAAPVVVETKKKKKKKYSNPLLRAVQEYEGALTKSTRKVTKAVREALDEYDARRDESRDKKKDGAVRDFVRNQSKALRKGLPVLAEAPADFLDAVADMKAVRRVIGK